MEAPHYTAWLCNGESCEAKKLGEGNDPVEMANHAARIWPVMPPRMIEVRRTDQGPPLLNARAEFYRRKLDLATSSRRPGNRPGRPR